MHNNNSDFVVRTLNTICNEDQKCFLNLHPMVSLTISRDVPQELYGSGLDDFVRFTIFPLTNQAATQIADPYLDFVYILDIAFTVWK